MDLSKPVDAAFTKALPKIELHAHLSGSISRQTLHEIWAKKKATDPTFSVEDPLVVLPPGKVDYSLKTFFTLFSKSIYQLINDLPSISFATHSVLSDFQADGIAYLELRTIPRSSPDGTFTKEAYLSTILSTISQFQATNPSLTVRLILSLDRGHTTPAEADSIVDLAIAHKPITVGVDIAGNPTKGDVARFGPALARAKTNGLGVTVHFAEVESVAAEGELETILGFGPQRLGHVIHVPEGLKKEIARRGLGLELCISCNVHAGMFEGGFAAHHFGNWWKRAECPVVLCTDDVGFFCSPVSNEYLLAAKHFDLSRADVMAICRKSVGVIFGVEEEKQRLHRLLDEFEANYRG
ncbi:Metallo-dependent hydrolase [Aspergillus leporis]|uniref:Metallo-dependent hydrolase n=1 Tax=Aspergillus leporis TaxID=41062 RepID=A0A5N5WX77_9EURO|nr:Metallo-dependent hydrolase [Aspergillus leporis]